LLPDPDGVALVLDDWHAAASQADFARYFGHYDPSGVFLGTDSSERWNVAEFRDYAAGSRSGWTYHARDRHIGFSKDGRVAWIDEKLDNASYGEVRGTGVLERNGPAWKLVHYSMSFPVPNNLARRVVALIRDG
jgi:hypothetical protein